MGEDVEIWGPVCSAVGMGDGAAAVETSVHFPVCQMEIRIPTSQVCCPTKMQRLFSFIHSTNEPQPGQWGTQKTIK